MRKANLGRGPSEKSASHDMSNKLQLVSVALGKAPRACQYSTRMNVPLLNGVHCRA